MAPATGPYRRNSTGRGRKHHHGDGRNRPEQPTQDSTLHNLLDHCERLDGKSYGAYKSLRGSHSYGDFTFFIDRVQSDPYAPPTMCRVQMPLAEAGLWEVRATVAAQGRLATGIAVLAAGRRGTSRLRAPPSKITAWTGRALVGSHDSRPPITTPHSFVA